MLYKFIDQNTIEKQPDFVKSDGQIIANPQNSEEGIQLLAEMGYEKELIESECPETDEGYYRNTVYSVEGDNIIRKWGEPVLKENPEKPKY